MILIEYSYVTCPHCKEEIRSYYTHDYKQCKCGKTFIDGGPDYIRTTPDADPRVKRKDHGNFIWTRANGERIKVKDLSNKHIINVLSGGYYSRAIEAEAKKRNLMKKIKTNDSYYEYITSLIAEYDNAKSKATRTSKGEKKSKKTPKRK